MPVNAPKTSPTQTTKPTSKNTPSPTPTPTPTASFALLKEKEISDKTVQPNLTYTTTVQTVPPSPPTEEISALTQQTPVDAEKADDLLKQSKMLSYIMKKYLGDNYLSKVQNIDINLIEKGNLIFIIFSNYSGTWRDIREDGIQTIISSIESQRILEEHFWYIMMAEKPIGEKIYIAIDCNHRLMAYKSLGIKTAKCLIFPNLPIETYDHIACKFFFSFIVYFI